MFTLMWPHLLKSLSLSWSLYSNPGPCPGPWHPSPGPWWKVLVNITAQRSGCYGHPSARSLGAARHVYVNGARLLIDCLLPCILFARSVLRILTNKSVFIVGGADCADWRCKRLITADDCRGRCCGTTERREGDGNGRWRHGRNGRHGLLGNW